MVPAPRPLASGRASSWVAAGFLACSGRSDQARLPVPDWTGGACRESADAQRLAADLETRQSSGVRHDRHWAGRMVQSCMGDGPDAGAHR
ncbi:hypothetical protein GCM10009730_61440 [Streptomyces albidochromogenes]